MDFKNTLKKYKKRVDAELKRFLSKQSTANAYLKKQYAFLQEFVLRPGKRIRPIASIMAYRAIKDKEVAKILPVSIVSELYHISSLAHDDIMDEDTHRRGKLTMHKVEERFFRKNFADKKKSALFKSDAERYGISLAVLQGNVLYSLAYSVLLDSKLSDKTKVAALQLFTDAYRETNHGQMFDLLISAKKNVIESEYAYMITGKTAYPLVAAIIFGALCNSPSKKQLNALTKYAFAVGLAFQVQDDILDLSAKKGRQVGTDLKKGNKTLMVIHALKKSTVAQKKILNSVLGNVRATSSQIKKAIVVLQDTGSIVYAQKYAQKKALEAEKVISKASLTKTGKEFFIAFARYMVTRKN